MRKDITARNARRLAQRGALFFVSHSGGKDSQAMYAWVRALGIPDDQIIVVHADLGEAEWPGTIDHIKASISHQLNIVRGTKTFFGIVEHRLATRPSVPSWPSAQYRDCTATLKRNPIYKFIRQTMKARGVSLAVNVQGLRAEESSRRAKQQPWKLNTALSLAGREVYDWLPVHHWDESQVKRMVADSGQTLGLAYQTGNQRMSCRFCIMGCASDLANAARQFPDLLERYEELERRTGYTFLPGKSLREKIAEAQPATTQQELDL